MLPLENSETKTLYLIDGSSYLYRAYHALPPLSNVDGEPTGAVFGVANMIRRLTIEHKPEYIAIVFDAKGKNFRHELYSDYKAHRPPMPDDLKVQIEPLHKLITAMGLPLVSIPGVEADDVIATLAKQAESEGWNTIISTIDKDIMQLVNKKIKVVNDMTKTEYNEEAIIKKFGIPSSLIVDYLSLIGDTADNVPGVPGVGPKTAVKWLNQYGSLDEIIANANQISNKVGENLRDNLDKLSIARQLIKLKHDVQLDFNVNDLKKKPIAQEQLITLLEALSFKSWLNEEQQEIKTTKIKNYKIINNKPDFYELLGILNNSAEFSFDTETTSLDPREAELVGLSFSINSDNAYYIPIGHIDHITKTHIPDQLELKFVLDNLTNLFSNNKIIKIAQNLKYDQAILNKYNINIAPPFNDTMLESYVYNSTANKHDLDTLAKAILNHDNITYEDVAGKGVKQINFSEVAITKAYEYAAEDADITLQLHKYFFPKLEADKKLYSVYTDIELPLINVLKKMEAKGVLVNCDLLLEQSKDIEQRLSVLSQNIFAIAQCEFNIDSPKQLQEILYDKLQLPILEKTPTGQASTAESTLQDLSLDFPIANEILEYRSLKKLKSTYTDRLPEQINPKTNRVHTSFHQAVTTTGRLSSTNPNLQNIPIKTEDGRKIRQAFIAEEDNLLISCDYSQIELRIMAHLSQDENLIKAFKNNLDIHSHTAAEIFGNDLNSVTQEQRRHAKAINFGLIYGMSSFGLAKQLNIDMNSAQAYIDIYFARYPGVKKYMDDIRKIAEQQGYVETLFGRRLYLPEIKSKNFMRRRAIERIAINAPMQGTAADIIKKAMIMVDKEINMDKTLSTKAFLILQVHDELILETHKDCLDQAKTILKHSMENAASLLVPLEVSCNIGKNWDEAH